MVTDKERAVIVSMRQAMNADVKVSYWNRFWILIDSTKRVEVKFMYLFAFAVLCFLTLWEANNAGSGWAILAKGMAPSWFAWGVGFASVVGAIVYHRRAAEFFEAGHKTRALRDGIITVLLSLLVLAGVYSYLSNKTYVSSSQASEMNFDRVSLRAEKRRLDADIYQSNIDIYESLVSVNEELINANVARGIGSGLTDLDATGACAADLSVRLVELCNSTARMRAENAEYQGLINSHYSKVARLDVINQSLQALTAQEGEAQWDGMARLLSAPKEDVRTAGLFGFSLAFLIVIIFGWHGLSERAEAAAREKEQQELGGEDGTEDLA